MKKMTLTLGLLFMALASFGQEAEKVRITPKEVPAEVIQIINDYITTLQNSADSIAAEKNVYKYLGGKLRRNDKDLAYSAVFNIRNDFKAARQITTPVTVQRASKGANSMGEGNNMITGTEYRVHLNMKGIISDYLPYIHVMVPNETSVVKEIRIVRCGQLDKFKTSK